ncbi:hypothetical protein HPB52_018319 [Rhipicephalus sanguineus]|uniref:Uncharacterized protein n=1 Tax=Rhipicephalus sanguineus TaxID=34632 RepID=A0A9D4PPX4_RHISA|nr:hypothetical protein HPB52_018319 [Rhipicephalus sanguineus]
MFDLLFLELLGLNSAPESATLELKDAAVLNLLFQELLGCPAPPESTTSVLRGVARGVVASDAQEASALSKCTADASGASGVTVLVLLFLGRLRAAPESANSELKCVARDVEAPDTGADLEPSNCTAGASGVMSLNLPFLDDFVLKVAPGSANSEVEGEAADSKESTARTTSELSDCVTGASGVTELDWPFLNLLGRLNATPESAISEFEGVAKTLTFNDSLRFVTSELKGVAAGTDPSDIWVSTTVLLDDSLAPNVGGLPRSATRLSVVDLSGLTKPTTRGRVLVVEITPCFPWIRIRQMIDGLLVLPSGSLDLFTSNTLAGLVQIPQTPPPATLRLSPMLPPNDFLLCQAEKLDGAWTNGIQQLGA